VLQFDHRDGNVRAEAKSCAFADPVEIRIELLPVLCFNCFNDIYALYTYSLLHHFSPADHGRGEGQEGDETETC